jgi:predicted aspartyl protease
VPGRGRPERFAPRRFAPVALLLLALPAACAAPCASGPVDPLPITFWQKLPLVPVGLNGRDMPFLPDTGATTTSLLPEVVAALGLRPDPQRQTEGYGIGGMVRSQNALLPELRLGGRLYSGLSLAVAPHAGGPTPQAGVLGADLLSTGDLEIDLPASRMVLHPPDACDAPAFAEAIPLEIEANGLVYLRLLANGVPLRALLDTGAEGTVISPATAQRLGAGPAVLAAAPVGRALGAGPGTVALRPWQLQEMVIGPEALREVPVMVAELPAALPADMVLGRDYMAQRHLWLSYARGQLAVRRVEARR